MDDNVLKKQPCDPLFPNVCSVKFDSSKIQKMPIQKRLNDKKEAAPALRGGSQ
jgi:hypothetical protein